MLIKNILKFLKVIKRIFINLIILHLNKKRYGINNHFGSSRELSLLYEYSDKKNPDQKLCSLISDIYLKYNQFDKIFKKPEILSSDPEEVVWDSYFSRRIGEHYRILPLIVNLINASRVIEIGTFRGASAKSILLNTNASINTFDLKKWDSFQGTYLNKEDFNDGLITQSISDLSKDSEFTKYSKILLEAEFLFIDGPKDYNFEKKFLKKLFNLYKNNPESELIVLMDDVRLSTMAKIWQSIDYPKCVIDMIGHWSGSGLIYLS